MKSVCSSCANELFNNRCKNVNSDPQFYSFQNTTKDGQRIIRSLAFRQSLPNGHLGLRAEEKAISELVSAIKKCCTTLDLETGKKLHEDAVLASFHKNKFVAALLIKLYSKCRRMELAERVFEEISHRDVVIWTSLIQGHVENGDHLAALKIFDTLDCEPTAITFVAALKACGSLAVGQRVSQKQIYLQKGIGIHKQLRERGLESNLIVATSLLNMYCKCGKMELARQVFDKMINRSVVTWSTLILGYAENGESSFALEMFDRIDCKPDTYAYFAALKACGSLAGEKESNKQLCLEKGISVHKQAVDSGLECDSVLGNALIDMYGKCRSVSQAREIFNSMRQRNVVTWTCMIQGYVGNGEYVEALELFQRMSCDPNSFTYVAALRACGLLAAEHSQHKLCLEKGRTIHKQLRGRGFHTDIVVATSLVDMYCKCRCLEEAKEIFDAVKVKSIFTWNALVLGYVDNGKRVEALELLSSVDCEADSYTYVAGLKACSKLASEKSSERAFCFEKGISIHRRIKQKCFDSDVIVATSLLDMYSKCGRMQHARDVFDTAVQRNVFTWTSIIQGYAENGEPLVALELLSFMDCQPNAFTFVAGLKACGSLAVDDRRRIGLEKAVALHQQARERGMENDVVLANALIDVYSKLGCMQRARDVFEGMVGKNVISWTTLMSGYVANGESVTALSLFGSMNAKPNSFTYAAVLKACATLASSEDKLEKSRCLEKGEAIHEQIKKQQVLSSDYFVSTALLDMYCRCGSMKHAKEVFDGIPDPDVVAWTTLIQGYVENGEGMVAMDTFVRMDIEVDSLTVVAALKACSSLGSLSLGRQIHATVCKRGLDQDQIVASSLIDFYAKCGSMNRAQDVFNSLHTPDIFSWNTLISGYSSIGFLRQVFDLGKTMQDAGIQPDDITALSVLTACSHSGLVEQGQEYFNNVLRYSSERLNVKHYRCMVDMLGRANRLQEAVALVKSMPFQADVITWTTLLDACRKWKNLELGKVAFDELAALKTTNAAAYVLMGEIYGA